MRVEPREQVRRLMAFELEIQAHERRNGRTDSKFSPTSCVHHASATRFDRAYTHTEQVLNEAEQVLSYRNAFLQKNESIIGCWRGNECGRKNGRKHGNTFSQVQGLKASLTPMNEAALKRVFADVQRRSLRHAAPRRAFSARSPHAPRTRSRAGRLRRAAPRTHCASTC